MGLDGLGGDEAADNREDDDFDQTEEIVCLPTEPRRSGRVRVSSKNTLKNYRRNVGIFRFNQVPRSHEHMVRVLATLARVENNEDLGHGKKLCPHHTGSNGERLWMLSMTP